MILKLDYKKTVFVGFAFFLICAFWQAYETLIPKILTDKFGLSQTVSGFIMALDNIISLFMLPLFGALSDRHHSRFGRRTPYIVIGTVISILLLVPFSFADRMQANHLDALTNDRGEMLSALWEADPEIRSPETGEKAPLTSFFESKESFLAIQPTVTENGREVTNPDEADYVIPARQAYARNTTLKNPGALIFFVGMLLLLLFAMATFRSPAVALMPDVTVRPLRSKANAVINLMGAAGGILILVLGILFGTGKPENALMGYGWFFAAVGAIMAISLSVFIWRVREPRLVQEAERETQMLGIQDEPESEEEMSAELAEGKHPGRGAHISMILILASVVLWFMGYNAITSKYSVYAGTVLGLDYNTTLIIAQAVAIVSYIPIGMLSSRIGRKRMILFGILALVAAFVPASFLRAGSSLLLVNLLFGLAGIGWAAINVNSFPMVVELCRTGNTGKYTGYYYTASMAAQTLTPVLSGLFLDGVSMTTLFPYAAACVGLAFFTMLFVRHGDARSVPAAEPKSAP